MEPKVEQFYFSANDIARHFGVSVNTVYRWQAPAVPAFKRGQQGHADSGFATWKSFFA